jgi:hypothetical protein
MMGAVSGLYKRPTRGLSSWAACERKGSREGATMMKGLEEEEWVSSVQ